MIHKPHWMQQPYGSDFYELVCTHRSLDPHWQADSGGHFGDRLEPPDSRLGWMLLDVRVTGIPNNAEPMLRCAVWARRKDANPIDEAVAKAHESGCFSLDRVKDAVNRLYQHVRVQVEGSAEGLGRDNIKENLSYETNRVIEEIERQKALLSKSTTEG